MLLSVGNKNSSVRCFVCCITQSHSFTNFHYRKPCAPTCEFPKITLKVFIFIPTPSSFSSVCFTRLPPTFFFELGLLKSIEGRRHFDFRKGGRFCCLYVLIEERKGGFFGEEILKMSTGVSTFVIRWINFLTLLVAVGVVGFGVWISTHHDGCRKSLTLPVLGLGALIFLISIIGFLGALKNNSILLWMYLIMLCLILLGILVFTVLAFIITNNSSGHNVVGLGFKEYQLQDYSKWFLKELNNTHNWKHLQSCLVKADDCSNLSKRYKTLKQYKSAKLTPIEAGCCRPPSQCGYPPVNASYYDSSFHPLSSNKDCKLYKNSKATKCYNCDSCKAGVAEYMKTEWRVVAIFNVVLFVVLFIIYLVGCCARRNAASSRLKS